MLQWVKYFSIFREMSTITQINFHHSFTNKYCTILLNIWFHTAFMHSNIVWMFFPKLLSQRTFFLGFCINSRLTELGQCAKSINWFSSFPASFTLLYIQNLLFFCVILSSFKTSSFKVVFPGVGSPWYLHWPTLQALWSVFIYLYL